MSSSEVPAAAVFPFPHGRDGATAAAGAGPGGALATGGNSRSGPAACLGVPGLDPDRRSLAEIELEAKFRGLLTEIDYLRLFGRVSAAEAAWRRRQARAFFAAAVRDLREWEMASGC